MSTRLAGALLVLAALAAVSAIHSDSLVVPLEGVSLAQEGEDVHTLDFLAKQSDSNAKQPGEQKKEEQAPAAKDVDGAVKKAAATADEQANHVSPPIGKSGGSAPDDHKNNEEQASSAKKEEQAPASKAASDHDAEPVHQKASGTPSDPPEPEAMKGDCAEGGNQGTNCECPDTPVAPRAAPTARPMAGPINEKADDGTDAEGETCNTLRRQRKARGLDPVTGKALKQKATELGESVGVGMGDSVLQKSIEDGTALERFHTGYNALKFAYDHDTPEQQHALTQEIEENPDAYQEGNLQATFKSFSNLRSVSDEKATSMLRQEADTYLNSMP